MSDSGTGGSSASGSGGGGSGNGSGGADETEKKNELIKQVCEGQLRTDLNFAVQNASLITAHEAGPESGSGTASNKELEDFNSKVGLQAIIDSANSGKSQLVSGGIGESVYCVTACEKVAYSVGEALSTLNSALSSTSETEIRGMIGKIQNSLGDAKQALDGVGGKLD